MTNLIDFIKEFKKTDSDFFMLNTSDEFLNEYIPESEMKLKWLTNFSGSNGIAIIGKLKKFFLTDGRYTLQAKNEIDKSFEIIDLTKMNLVEFSKKFFSQKSVLLDFRTFSYKTITQIINVVVKSKGIVKHDNKSIIDLLWKDRPISKKKKIFLLENTYTGKSVLKKHEDIFKDSKHKIYIITSPDSICWFLNIRGADLDNTPIVMSRLIITKKKIKVFLDLEKIPDKFLHPNKIISFFPLKSFEKQIRNLKKDENIFLDSNVSYFFYRILKNLYKNLTVGQDPCKILKAQKNKSEIQSSKNAHIKDGISLTKFFCWLENQKLNSKLTEFSVAKKLEEFRKEHKDFFSLSFPTISSVGSNGSIIHYKPEKSSSLKLQQGKLFLCDSGGQYLGGTTDVTRTVILGTKKPKKEYIRIYTKILIGHINLSMLRFPVGTRGFQIDSIARQALWESGLDFNHGTGHGVGSFLCVHEGPQSISKAFNSIELKEGMIISNEPGYYKNGEFGIRIENLILIKKSKFTNFLEFEPLTLFPYEDKLIDKKLLNTQQKSWINSYYKKIYKELSINLKKSEKSWLREKTKKII